MRREKSGLDKCGRGVKDTLGTQCLVVLCSRFVKFSCVWQVRLCLAGAAVSGRCGCVWQVRRQRDFRNPTITRVHVGHCWADIHDSIGQPLFKYQTVVVFYDLNGIENLPECSKSTQNSLILLMAMQV